MAAPAVAASGAPSAGAASGNSGGIPFFYGSNRFVQKFDTFNQQLGAGTVEHSAAVPPNGFLRGVRLQLRSTGGVAGTVTQDNPWNVFYSITLENVNGSPIMYPMGGYAYYTMQWASRPWHGIPSLRYDFAASQNPSGSLNIFPEVINTVGVLANTDARSQYRCKYTLNTAANVVASGTTAPTVTVTAFMETWAQPDSADLHGNPIQALPDGLNLTTLRRHQILTFNGAGATTQAQLTNVGNEYRCLALIVRDSNLQRQDYLADPVRWTLDDRSLGVFAPDEIFNTMQDFYVPLNEGTFQRPTGVYVFPRYLNNNNGLEGSSWLASNNATFLNWELTTIASAVNLPGTIEIISDEILPTGPYPTMYESI